MHHQILQRTPLLIVVAAPNWILGCLLAERMAREESKAPTPAAIWAWRLGAIAISAGLKAFVSHGQLRFGYPESHWTFAIYVYFRVGRELAFHQLRPAFAAAEAAGRASYSLYLVHGPTIAAIGISDLAPATFGATGWTSLWAAQLLAIGSGTWLFYVAVERPFHRLARRIGSWLELKAAAVATPDASLAPFGRSINLNENRSR
jgi:peptidoglycan/LPS O-acetylase OafA/YrhL